MPFNPAYYVFTAHFCIANNYVKISDYFEGPANKLMNFVVWATFVSLYRHVSQKIDSI